MADTTEIAVTEPTAEDWAQIVAAQIEEAKKGKTQAATWLRQAFGFGVSRRGRAAFPIEDREERRARLLRIAEKTIGGNSRQSAAG